MMKNLLQNFNILMNNVDLWKIHDYCLVIGCAIMLIGVVGSLFTNGGHKFTTVSCIIASIILATSLAAGIYANLPGYVPKSPGVDYVDNNGVFGTGYGGVDKPAKITPPATYTDPETGTKKSVKDDGPGAGWSPDDKSGSVDCSSYEEYKEKIQELKDANQSPVYRHYH